MNPLDTPENGAAAVEEKTPAGALPRTEKEGSETTADARQNGAKSKKSAAGRSGGKPKATADAGRSGGKSAVRAARLSPLPPRFEYANKGTFGTVGVVAGSKNMAGAAYLAAKAAYACGAGLVKIITVEENRVILQTLLPEAVLFTYDDETPLGEILKAAGRCTSLVIGPGLGQKEKQRMIVCALLSECGLPTVLDADGLNLAARTDLIKDYRGKLVLTPHPGEAARLLGCTVGEITDDPEAALCRLTALGASAVVLKGAGTFIGDGKNVFLHNRPNSGMAKGGSGDVLAGICGELLAEYDDPLAAAVEAVALHGEAGAIAAKKYGKRPMSASRVIEGLEEVLKKIEGSES